MPDRRIRIAVLLLAVTLSLGWRLTRAGSGRDAADEAKIDAAAVRAVLDRQVADWNRHDLDAFLVTYDRSPATVFFSGGDRTEGWDAMRDRYRKRYQGEGKEMGTLTFRDVDVEPFSASAAFARGRWELTLADGSRPGGLFTLILRKTADGWKIVHDHTSAAVSPASPEQPAPVGLKKRS